MINLTRFDQVLEQEAWKAHSYVVGRIHSHVYLAVASVVSFVVLSDEVIVTQSRRLSMNLVDLVGIADVWQHVILPER